MIKTVRSGCSGLIGLVLLSVAAFMAFGWPSYIDRHGTPASAVIKEKHENIRVWYSEWYRRFEIVAAYPLPGRPFHETACYVDEKTYDSLHVGESVEAHYFPGLMVQPFVSADHLTPCTLAGSISRSSSVSPNLLLALVPLVVLLLFGLVFRIKAAAWLFLISLCIAVPYLIVPRIEPAPQQPVPATAQVDWVTEITRLEFGHTRRRDIDLTQPYEIVRLRFQPSGKDTPVTAVDKIDRGSIPNLQRGQTVPIVYDARDPRVARLQQGTREFARKAGIELVEIGVVIFIVMAIAYAIGGVFRRAGQRR